MKTTEEKTLTPALIKAALREILHHLATSSATEPGPNRCPWAHKAYEITEELYERLTREAEA